MMKKILFTLVLTMLVAVSTFAQHDTGSPKWVRADNGAEMRIDGTMNGTTYDTLATGWIDMSDYDATNEYIQIYYQMTGDANPSGLADTTWLYVNAVGNELPSFTGAVTLAQLVDTTNSETAAYVASTISNLRPKYINFIFGAASTVSGGDVDDSVDIKAVVRFPIKDAKAR